MKLLVVTPRATEKAYRLVTGQNTYVFNVPLSANKNEIKAAVEAENKGVKVASIKTVVQNGKAVRFSRGKNRNPGSTTRQNSKKAYVTLAEGHSLPFFNAIEEEQEKEQASQEKFDKAVSKQVAKDSKPARRGILRKKAKEEEADK